MKRGRMSILGLMGVVLVIGVCLVSLRLANQAWAGTVVSGTFMALCVSALGIAYRREAKRAFWLGFAVLGWGYLLLGARSTGVIAMISVSPSGQPEDSQAVSQVWPTEQILGQIYPYVHLMSGSGENPSFFAALMGLTDARNRAILRKLDLPLSMPFKAETPLEDVIRYIKDSTADSSLPTGIPIYVDPVGLQEAEKTLLSPITFQMDGMPLRQTLKILLRQLDLIYEVKDGLMTITYIKTSHKLDEEKFVFMQVGHSWCAILAGILGGMVGKWFYRTRDAA